MTIATTRAYYRRRHYTPDAVLIMMPASLFARMRSFTLFAIFMPPMFTR